MRRRLLSLGICAVLLVSLVSCSGSKLAHFQDTDVLLSVEDEVLLTVLDFRRLMVQQTVSHEIKQTEELSEKELFIQQAQIALLSYFAEEYGLAYDRSALEDEYDSHMLEIQDMDVYGNELLFASTLQSALDMDNETFRTWNVDESMKDYNMHALLEDIAQLYRHITDEEILKEFLQVNLLQLYEIYEVEIYYPGVQLRDLDFFDLL